MGLGAACHFFHCLKQAVSAPLPVPLIQLFSHWLSLQTECLSCRWVELLCSQPDPCAWGGPVRDARSLIYSAKSRNCKITWNWALRTVWRLSFWLTGGYLNTHWSHYLKLWPWLIWVFTSATALYITEIRKKHFQVTRSCIFKVEGNTYKNVSTK